MSEVVDSSFAVVFDKNVARPVDYAAGMKPYIHVARVIIIIHRQNFMCKTVVFHRYTILSLPSQSISSLLTDNNVVTRDILLPSLLYSSKLYLAAPRLL